MEARQVSLTKEEIEFVVNSLTRTIYEIRDLTEKTFRTEDVRRYQFYEKIKTSNTIIQKMNAALADTGV